MNEKQEWIAQTVRYYQGLGFLTQYNALNDEELVAQLKSQYRENHQEFGDVELENDLNTGSEIGELILLQLDKSRIWWEDLEQDIYYGDDTYRRIVQDWSNISRGVFVPESIKEVWQSEEGPMQIEVVMNRTKYHLVPNRFYDEPQNYYGWIDLELLNQVNELIKESNYRFEVYEPFDQTGFVVVLTPEEKRKLAQERDWRFADLNEL